MKTAATQNQTVRTTAIAAAAAATVIGVQVAVAGANGTEFQNIWDLLVGWSEGYLGKIIALGMIMYGLGAGLVQQNLKGCIVGLGGGLILFYGPSVIDDVVGAVM